MTDPEFSRPVRIDTLGAAPRRVDIAANEGERAALARRFRLVSLNRLEAEMELRLSGDAVIAAGRVRGEAEQSCVVTGEPVAETIDEPIELVFRTPPEGGSAEEEVELGEGEMDVVFYQGAAVDAGEAAAETLALALNPYPRSPAAAAALAEAGVKSEEEAQTESSPFAALAALKDKLGK